MFPYKTIRETEWMYPTRRFRTSRNVQWTFRASSGLPEHGVCLLCFARKLWATQNRARDLSTSLEVTGT